MSTAGSTWQRADVARAFVEERRTAVPYGIDQIRVMLQVVSHLAAAPRRIVDLGCGDGILGRMLLQTYPDAGALLLDHSAPMLERARKEMERFGARCDIRHADLCASLLAQTPAGSADVVVSGYAIHHLPDDRKRELYAEIHQVLVPGGVFVNLEHVASPSPELELLFEQLYIRHMASTLDRTLEDATRRFYERPDKADNILAPLEVQLHWLRELGFEQVDCYFKWMELAVFGGRKPGSEPPGP